MRFLLLNQTFYPDVMATGQYLGEVAVALAEAGHDVTVIASRRAYDDPTRLFPSREIWRGIKILRVPSTGFGKKAKWRRALDFASFLLLCACRIFFQRKHDVVVALTSPPLISVLGASAARFWRARFFYWIMDLNPDEAIAAGWLTPGSPFARVLEHLSRFSLRTATANIALDSFMANRLLKKGLRDDAVVVFPPWSQDDDVRYDEVLRESFRKAHGVADKFVVMYSGNHSPCHPLTSLLEAAQRLDETHPDISFCFVGGGSEFQRVKDFVAQKSLSNVVCLPYQPLSELSASLSAADLHVVVMGDPFVGLVHPCKIYNILALRAPVLYIGPDPSHVTELLKRYSTPGAVHPHGDTESIARSIMQLAETSMPKPARTNSEEMNAFHDFSRKAVLPRLLALITSSGKPIDGVGTPLGAAIPPP